jgi:DNA-binding MarR family transcriptional regulator
LSFQRRAKKEHRENILRIIGSRQPNFKDLQKEVGLTPPTLSKHLKALVGEGIVAREFRGTRRVFILTNKGKSEEQKRRESIPALLEVLKLLVREPTATKTLLSGLSDLAKENPTLVEMFMKEFTLLMSNDDVLQWIVKHPGVEGANVLKREVTKRMKKPEQFHHVKDEETMRVTFQLLTEALRDITSKESKKAQDR